MAQTLTQEDLDAIKALFTAGDMVMSLKRLVVVNDTSDPAFYVGNSAGTATEFESTGGDGRGLFLVGHGGGTGFRAVGGDTGRGMDVFGGNTSGDAVGFFASAAGHGLVLYSAGDIFSALSVDASDAPGANAIEILGGDAENITPAGAGVAIASAGPGKHDIALVGSGTILGGAEADPEADRGSTGGDLTTTLMIERIYRRLFRPASRSKADGKMVLKDNAGDTVASMDITDDGAGEETQGAMS